MIAKLTGVIDELKPTELVLDVNGVGYHVHIPLSTYAKIQLEKKLSLHIFTLHKEDQMKLFGFFSMDEKELFQVLLGVQGIGPAVALSIISGVSAELLADAVRNENPGILTKIPGIGRTKAEKIVFELKRKLKKLDDFAGPSAGREPTLKRDAVDALTSLGFDETKAFRAVDDVIKECPDIPLEAVIKDSLKRLSGQ